MHVERTDDPAVMRWVCHDDALAASSTGRRVVPDDSPLGWLVADGSLVDVTVRGGDVLVRAGSPDSWSTLAPVVQDRLALELVAKDGVADHWLLSVDATGDTTPSVDDVQHVVDRSAGAITATHGGAMTVVAVEGSTVRLQAQGACDGCRQSDDTALAIIAPAVRAEFPQLVDIVVESTAPAHPGPARSHPLTEFVRFGRR